MILLQMFPIAVACGNTFILKPSEKDPGDCDLNFVYLILELYLPQLCVYKIIKEE